MNHNSKLRDLCPHLLLPRLALLALLLPRGLVDLASRLHLQQYLLALPVNDANLYDIYSTRTALRS